MPLPPTPNRGAARSLAEVRMRFSIQWFFIKLGAQTHLAKRGLRHEEDRLAAISRIVGSDTGIVDNLKRQLLWDQMTLGEQELACTPESWLDRVLLWNRSWAIESLATLAWACGLEHTQGPVHAEADLGRTLDLGVFPPQDLLGTLKLRPTEELEQAHQVARLWHQRCELHAQHAAGEDAKAGAVDALVVEATDVGAFPAALDGDFPVDGRAFRDMPEGTWNTVQHISRERHRALNWLLGIPADGDWDAALLAL